jgi:hypothetical protein
MVFVHATIGALPMPTHDGLNSAMHMSNSTIVRSAAHSGSNVLRKLHIDHIFESTDQVCIPIQHDVHGPIDDLQLIHGYVETVGE